MERSAVPLMIAALLRLVGMVDTGSVLVTLATVTVAALLLLAAAQALHQPRASLSRIRTTLRERTLRTAFLPQGDPDAAGRPRPRAPGLKIILAS